MLTFDVYFDEPVSMWTWDGAAEITDPLEVIGNSARLPITYPDADWRSADYVSGSGTNRWRFVVPVYSWAPPVTGLALRDSHLEVYNPLRDPDGVDADLTLPSVDWSGIVIEAPPPTYVQAVLAPGAGWWPDNAPLTYTLVFNQPVTVQGAPQLPLLADDTPSVATYVSGSGTDRLQFEFTAPIGATYATGLFLQGVVGLPPGAAIRDGNGDELTELRFVPPNTPPTNWDATVRVSDSAVNGWGGANFVNRFLDPTTLSTIRELGDGWGPFCAVTEPDGAVVCGGDQTAANVAGPQTVTSGAKGVYSNNNVTCVIQSDDSVACFGSSGTGTHQPPPGLRAKKIAFGTDHACAITTTDSLECWGGDQFTASYAQSAEQSGVLDVAMSQHITCVVRFNNSVQCYGYPNYMSAYGSPPGGLQAVDISGEFGDFCAINTSGTPVCWGQGSPPVFPSGITDAVEVHSGRFASCVLRASGYIACTQPSLQPAFPVQTLRMGLDGLHVIE